MASESSPIITDGIELPAWRADIPEPSKREVTAEDDRYRIPIAGIMSAIKRNDPATQLDNLKQLRTMRYQMEEALAAQEQRPKSEANRNVSLAHVDYLAQLTLLGLVRMNELLLKKQSEQKEEDSADATSIREFREQMIAVQNQLKAEVAVDRQTYEAEGPLWLRIEKTVGHKMVNNSRIERSI